MIPRTDSGAPRYPRAMLPANVQDRARGWLSDHWTWISAHRIRLILAASVLVVGLGTVGYMFFGGLGLVDSLYMAVITISTVGFTDLTMEAARSSTGAKIFTVIYIMVGVAVGAATVSAVAATMVEGRIREVLGRRRMKRQVSQLDDHIILCGYGRFGQLAAEELRLEEIPFVIIDTDSEMIDLAESNGMLALHADATEEETMHLAGIERARALLCSLPNDAHNVYAILNAFDARSGTDAEHKRIPIVVLARERRAERKLRMAGATHVVQPYEIGARHMAQQIISPHVARLMGMATERGLEAAGVRMREFPVAEGSPLAGVALKDSPVRRDFNVMIVGVIEGEDGEPRYNPGPDYVVCPGDVLVAVGPTSGLVRLRSATQAADSTIPPSSR